MRGSIEKDTLLEFLSFRPEDPMPVLRRFAGLKGAISHFDGVKMNFVYVPGTRSDRVVLVAHADTVWDRAYGGPYFLGDGEEPSGNPEHRPVKAFGIIRQGGWKGWGLGADDRAGCAILWLLRNSGHSLLVTDGEEHGQIGAHHLMDHYPELASELNAHRYMIQLDRRNGCDYKTYDLPVTDEFRAYVEKHTGFKDAGHTSRTDIVALCTRICGVNLSVGYSNEHHSGETINVKDWMNTYCLVEKLLEKEQPAFPLQTYDD